MFLACTKLKQSTVSRDSERIFALRPFQELAGTIRPGTKFVWILDVKFPSASNLISFCVAAANCGMYSGSDEQGGFLSGSDASKDQRKVPGIKDFNG